tara:strand:+ start:18 stop:257 length:240 start_codon:yes stop_codon:yes gene_type:complete
MKATREVQKDDQTDFIVDRFTIVDRDEGIIAVREKASVQIDKDRKEVKMHDYSYTFNEIIAVADQLKAIMPVEKKLTFS